MWANKLHFFFINWPNNLTLIETMYYKVTITWGTTLNDAHFIYGQHKEFALKSVWITQFVIISFCTFTNHQIKHAFFLYLIRIFKYKYDIYILWLVRIFFFACVFKLPSDYTTSKTCYHDWVVRTKTIDRYEKMK